MPDLSNVSNDELMKIYNQGSQSRSGDISTMSDSDLMRLYENPEPAKGNNGLNERAADAIRSQNQEGGFLSPRREPIIPKMGRFAGRMVTGALADTIEDPVETLVVNPAKAAARLPQGVNNQISGLAAMAEAPFNPDKSFKGAALNYGKSVMGQGLNSLEASALLPPAKGVGAAGTALKQNIKQTGQNQAARNPVMDALLRMAKSEGQEPSDLIRNASAPADNGAMLFQQLNIPQVAQGLGNRAGASRDIMSEAAQRFQAGQSGRVESIFKKGLGNPDESLSIDGIIKKAREKAAPLYAAALSPDVRPDIGRAMNKPALKSYLDKAQNKLSSLGKDNASPMELLHEAQQMIGGKANAFGRSGDTYEAGLAGVLRRDLMDIGKEASPDYAEATRLFRDDMQIKDAFDAGSRAISGKDRFDFSKQAQSFTPEQKKAAASGMLQSLQQKLDIPESYSAVRTEVRRPSFQNNLAALVGDKQASEAIANLSREVELAEMANGANFARGSKTAPTQQAIGLVDNAATPGVRRLGGKAAAYVADRGISPLDAVRDATRAGGRKIQQAVDAPNEDIVTEVAKLLTMDAEQGRKILLQMPIEQQRSVMELVNRGGLALSQSGQAATQGFGGASPLLPLSAIGGQMQSTQPYYAAIP